MADKHNKELPVRTPTPSTPPFLDLASPDLKNFKSFLRSPSVKIEHSPSTLATLPPTSNSNDLLFGQISDLDFESAYAILTKSPGMNTPPTSSFNASLSQNLQYIQPKPNTETLPQNETQPTPHQQNQHSQQSLQQHFGALKSPRSVLFPPDSTDFKTLFFQAPSPSPKMMSPKIDLDSLAYFNQSNQGHSDIFGHSILDEEPTNELLSVNESNALERFLDSIMDDKIKDDKEIKGADFRNHLQSPLPSFDGFTGMDGKDNSTGSNILNQKSSLASASTHQTLSSIESLQTTSGDQDQKTRKEPDSDPQPIPKKQRKRRKLLSEEEKKLNHTSSEQRRRALIKKAFDDLVRLLPLDQESTTTTTSRRKNHPKSIILEKTVVEIEKIEKMNNELRKMLEQNGL